MGDRSVASERARRQRTHSGVKRSKRTTLVRALERPPRFPNNLVLRPRARERQTGRQNRDSTFGFGLRKRERSEKEVQSRVGRRHRGQQWNRKEPGDRVCKTGAQRSARRAARRCVEWNVQGAQEAV